MLIWIWFCFANAIATEGVSNLQDLQNRPIDTERPWGLEVQQLFWLSPTIHDGTGWKATDVSDVLMQRLILSHQIDSRWLIQGHLSSVFVGSQEVYRRGNSRVGAAYRRSIGRWENTTGLDLFGSGSAVTTLSFTQPGLYPHTHFAYGGGRWLIDIDTGVFWSNGLFPQGSIQIQRNRNTDVPTQFGLETMTFTEGSWSALTIKTGLDLEVVTIQTVYRRPLRFDTPFEGSVFELNLLYTPTTIQRDTDRDRDGIPNVSDFCTDEPEDLDGFEDEDGCPDVDNDQDGVLDLVDQCPNFAEDTDGYNDTDGCPDVDNDQDNILDTIDRCPSQPETINQFQDHDGCPDTQQIPDFDGDGFGDHEDNCPFEAEDFDDQYDHDGCPDPDNMPQWLDRLQPSNADEP